MVDFHIHSGYSYDNDPVPVDEQIRTAIDVGLTDIAITDHYDPLFPSMPAELDFPRYMDELAELKERYAGQIRIAAGVELGMQPGRALELCAEAVSSWPFDFIIASVHAVDGYGLHTPEFAHSRSRLDSKIDYYTSLLECIRGFDDFDVLGHLNVIDRYTPKIGQNDKVDALIGEILELIISREQGIEINTSSLRRGHHHTMPPEDVVKRYAELGGKIITTSSDAHSPRNVGNDIEKAEEIIHSVGINKVAAFYGRKLFFV